MSKPGIYEQHDAAFKNISAYAILKNGERVATAAFKHGGRAWCYLHAIGTPMQRGSAGGGGYDRSSAAFWAAAARIAPSDNETAEAIRAAALSLASNEGRSWERQLEDAGFTVAKVI